MLSRAAWPGVLQPPAAQRLAMRHWLRCIAGYVIACSAETRFLSEPAAVTLLTCEHGGNRVPARYAGLLRDRRLLDSHRGHDIGSLDYARRLARALDIPLIASTTTRLLVDLNRSPGHCALFSPAIRRLPAVERQRIVDRYYTPYRQAVEKTLRHQIEQRGRALHLSVHSFAPVLAGVRRNADLGLLYDPGRRLERLFCKRLAARLRELAPSLRVRRNYPYRGSADGLTTSLRRQFPASQYAGVELEINQAIVFANGRRRRELLRLLVLALAGADRIGL
jgi:predicted N-formylglutamate amidohydrolase